MPLSFEDEMQAFLTHRYEQMPEIQEILVQGRASVDSLEGLNVASQMIGVHNEALILVAMEIDKLRASIAEG